MTQFHAKYAGLETVEAMAKEKDAKAFEILPEDTVTVGEKFI